LAELSLTSLVFVLQTKIFNTCSHINGDHVDSSIHNVL